MSDFTDFLSKRQSECHPDTNFTTQKSAFRGKAGTTAETPQGRGKSCFFR